jgi:hypothetical protein
MLKISMFRVAATIAAICLCGPAWALGSTPVTVVNPADIAKSEGIQHPYQTEVQCLFENNSNVCFTSFTSPTSQRLVFEFISGQCFLNSAQDLISLFISTTIGGQSAQHFISSPPSRTFFGGMIVNFGQAVRIYADQNTTINFEANSSDFANSSNSCNLTISGQAIDVP